MTRMAKKLISTLIETLIENPDTGPTPSMGKVTNGYWGWSTNAVTYGNGKFIALSNISSNFGLSYDGVNWTTYTVPEYTPTEAYNIPYLLTFCQGYFYISFYKQHVDFTRGGGFIYRSVDGIKWDRLYLDGEYIFTNITYGNGKYLASAVSVSNNYVDSVYRYYESFDGINWNPTGNWKTGYVSGLKYGNGKFVSIRGMTALDYALPSYSTDGINWIDSPLSSSTMNSQLVFGNGNFFLHNSGLDNGNYYLKSVDGVSWSYGTYNIGGSWQAALYGGGRFLCLCPYDSWYKPVSYYHAEYSDNLINWTNFSLPSSGNWSIGTYGQGKFVLISDVGGVLVIG